jgi:hypothetical protein
MDLETSHVSSSLFNIESFANRQQQFIVTIAISEYLLSPCFQSLSSPPDQPRVGLLQWHHIVYNTNKKSINFHSNFLYTNDFNLINIFSSLLRNAWPTRCWLEIAVQNQSQRVNKLRRTCRETVLLWANHGSVLEFFWMEWGKPRTTLVSSISVPANIRTGTPLFVMQGLHGLGRMQLFVNPSQRVFTNRNTARTNYSEKSNKYYVFQILFGVLSTTVGICIVLKCV